MGHDGGLEDAELASRVWSPDAESRLRSAITAAASAGHSDQLAAAWLVTTDYLRTRAALDAAALALVAAREAARSMTDTRVEQFVLGELHDVLGELGDEEGFAATGGLLAGRSNDHRSEKMLGAAIGRRQRVLPDFERGFVNGDLAFDQGVDLMRMLAKPVDHPSASLLRTGFRSEQRAHRRQLRRRIIWPAIPFVLVVAALAAYPLRPNAVVWSVVLALAAIYAAFWMGAVRASWGWVAANRRVSGDSDFLAKLIEGDSSSSHAEAVTIIERFISSREPFTLYLRSFEPEAFETLGPPPAGQSKAEHIRSAILAGIPAGGYIEADQYAYSTVGSVTKSEEYLAEHLTSTIPVIAVANPAAQLVQGSSVPRLSIANEMWSAAVRPLMSAAHLVIVELTTASPGVFRELGLIKELSREQDTILIVPSAETVRSLQLGREVFSVIARDAIARDSEIIQGSDEALRGLPRIVSDASFGDADPSELPVFHGLLPDGPKLGVDDYSSRRRDRLLRLSAAAEQYNEGNVRLRQRQYADAVAAFKASAEATGLLGDVAQQAIALNAEGKALLDAGDAAQAVDALAAAAEIQRQTGPPLDYIGSLHHQGLALLTTGAIARAREVFERMQSESQRWGYARGAARALESLGMCALAEDDLTTAAEHLQQAAEMADDPRDQSSIFPVLAKVEARRGAYGSAASWFAKAGKVSGELGNTDLNMSARYEEIVATYSDGAADLEKGETESAIGKLNRAVTLSRELKAADLEQMAIFRLGMAHSRSGDKQAAIADFSEAADIAHRIGDESKRWLAISNLGVKLIETGQSEKAVGVLRDAEQWQRENDPDELVYTLEALGIAHFTIEDYDASFTYDGEALAHFDELGDTVRAASAAERVGFALLCSERYADARAALLEAAGRPGIADNPGRLAEILKVAAGAARLMGDDTAAVDLLNKAVGFWDQAGDAKQAAQARTTALSIGDDSIAEPL